MRRRIDTVGKTQRLFFMWQRDIGSHIALHRERVEKRGHILRPHGLSTVVAINLVVLQPIAVNCRRAGMLDRPPNDAGAAHGSALDRALAPQGVEQRQQGKAQDGKIIAVDFLEQLDAESFELIGADGAQHLLAGGSEIAADEFR